MNYKEKYIQSILASLSYIDFNSNYQDRNFIDSDLESNIEKKLFKEFVNEDYKIKYKISGDAVYNDMLASIDLFIDNFIIVKQIVNTGFDGFSAITYKLKKDIIGTFFKSGDIFVSYRGTEATQIGDLITDFALSFTSNLKSFTSQESQALDYLKNEIKTHNDVRICGHSLGGYLAARSYYYLNEEEAKKIKEVTTFNGAGFSTVIGNPFIYKNTKYGNKVTNFFSYRGLEVTTGNLIEFLKGDGNISLFQHLGKRIKLVTENPGGMGNHSMSLMVTSLGFYSILQKLLEKNKTLKDYYDSDFNSEQEYSYAIERIMMTSVPLDADFGKMFINLSKTLISSFGLPINLSIYASPISQVLSLQDSSLLTSDLKIELIDGISFSPYGKDNNRKRSIMYALLNDIPYITIVPENYRFGIYNKDNKENDKYNMEYYNKDFLVCKALYNNVITYLLEKKILDSSNNVIYKPKIDDEYPAFNKLNLTNIYEHINAITGKETITESGIYKFAFIDYQNQNRIIYVNTDPESFKTDSSRAIYFSGSRDFSHVIYDNSIVFDSFEQNTINISAPNAIVYSLNNFDSIIFNDGSINSVYVADDIIPKEKVTKTLHNLLYQPIDIRFQNFNLNEIQIADRGKGNIIIRAGNISLYTTTYVEVAFNLITKDTSINNIEIKRILNCFNENFTGVNNSNLIVNKEFLDKYTLITKKRYNRIIRRDESTITQEHFDFIKEKIEMYYSENSDKPNNLRNVKALKSNSISTNDELKNEYLENLKSQIEEKTFIPDDLIPFVQDNFIYAMRNREYSSDIREIFTPKFSQFTNTNFSSTKEFDVIENASYNNIIDNIYYKKETPIREKIYDENGNWDGGSNFSGEYTYNRKLNGVQLNFVYSDNLEEGEPIEYYKENILINAISSQYDYNPVTGSKGSDIIYTNGDIKGEPNNYDKRTNNILVSYKGAVTINHGNNFIIGKKVEAGDGSNLVISSGNVIFNQNNSNAEKENYAIDCSGYIMSGNTKTYTAYCNKVLGNGNNLSIRDGFFIGGKEASLFYETFLINEGVYNPEPDPIIVEYYKNHPLSIGKNEVYSLNGIAFLNPGDYVYAQKSKVYSVGQNKIIAIDSEIRSGGNSDIEIYGKSNVYLGLNDVFATDNARESIIYGIGNPDLVTIYNINGEMNHLNLGSGDFIVNFNGSLSKLTVNEDQELLELNIKEFGKNIIKTKNIETLNLTTNSDSEIEILHVGEFNYNYSGHSRTEINAKVRNKLLTNINLRGEADAYLDFSGSNLTIGNLISTNSISSSIRLDENSSVKNIDVDCRANLSLYKKNITENITLKTEKEFFSFKNSTHLDLQYYDSLSIAFMKEIDEVIISIPYENQFSLNCEHIENLIIEKGNIQLSHWTEIDASISNLIINMDNSTFYALGPKIDNTILNSTQPVEIVYNKWGYRFNDIQIYKNIPTININNKAFSVSELTQIIENQPSNSSSIILDENGYKYIIEIIEPIPPEKNYIYITGTDEDENFDIDKNSNYNIESSNGNDNYRFLDNNLNINNFIFNNTQGISTFNTENNTILNLIFKETDKNSLSFDIFKDNEFGFENLNIYLNNTLIINIKNYILFSVNIELKYKNNINMNISIEEIEASVYNIYGSSDSDIINGNESKFSNIFPNENTRIINLKGSQNNIHFSDFNHDLTINSEFNSSYTIIFDNAMDLKNLKFALNGPNGLNIFDDDKLLLSLKYAFSGHIIKLNPYDEINFSSVISKLRTINGTENDDVLYGNSDGESVIYPSKGNDIINIVGGNNSIYYNIGDGLKTINNPNKVQVRLVFPENMDQELLTFSLKDHESVFIFYENKLIIEWDNVLSGYIQFGNSNDMISGYQILNKGQAPTPPIEPPHPDNEIILNGTDGNDILTGGSEISLFKPGKGEDVINIIGGSNTIEYSSGDGFKTIYNPSFSAVIIKISNIKKESFSYELTTDGNLNIKENGNLIFNIKQPNATSLQFMNNYEFVNLYDIVQELSTINGTDNNDKLNGKIIGSTNIFNPKKGNDIINIVSDLNQINYSIGDGYKVVSNPNFKSVVLVLDKVLNRSLLTYQLIDEKLNIYYDNELIFNLENPFAYSIQFKDTYDYIYMYQVISDLNK